MSEIRIEPITGRPIILARERQLRPEEFASPPPVRHSITCPFCAGNEWHTPEAFATYGASDSGPWSVRVVPNKFPAVSFAPAASVVGPAQSLHATLAGTGAHEVIVESPRHVSSLSQLTEKECLLTFRAYRERLQAARQNEQHAAALVFKNVGPEAGASLEHTHSQLLGLPLVPPQVREELTGARAYWETHGRCVYCDLTAQALAQPDRLVAESARFVAYCPFASRLAYETWIVPRVHASEFEATADEALAELSLLVRSCVARLDGVAARPAYNYFIHSAPFRESAHPFYHWHMELFPRLTKLAGFEWGAGCFINAVPPEEAAAQLRAAQPVVG